MKRSSPSLQFLATAATSAEASTRPPYRGARSEMPRRFSDQSFSGGGGRGQIFTGDSHFLSTSDANQGLRPVERTNYDNQIGYRSQARSPFCNPQSHFNPPPHWYTPPPIITPYFNPHPPSFNQNQCNRPPQQFRPRPPKPLDYRNWKSAKLGPPPPCERFKVLSYNILADYLAMNHRSKLYFHIPEKMLEWEWRKKNIIFELGLWSADILCFQEVDKFQDLEEELKLRGYSGIWKMRTGVPVDGCAIFWRVSRFKLLHEECIEFNKLGLRDNVAQICVLESLNQTNNKDMSALPLSLTGSNKVVICNIHVLYNPKRGEIKLGQIRVLLDRAHAVSKLWDDAPVILSGDFNCTPKSPLYNYISEQKLNLSDLPRDKLSGQASAEIRPPRPFSPNIRPQAADSRGGASVLVDHRELSQSGSLPERISVNLPSINSSSQPQCVKTGSNVYANNPSSGQRGSRNGASSAEWTKGTHQEVDGYKDATPDGGLKESPSSSQNRVWVFVEQMKDRHCENIYSNFIERELTKETHQDTVEGCNNEFHSVLSTSGLKDSAVTQKEGEVPGAQREGGCEFSSVNSRHEDLIEAEHKKQTYATVDAQCDTSIEQSERSLHTENKITSGGKSKPFFLSSYNTTDAITYPTTSGTSSSELFHETCLPSTMKVSTMGSSDSFSSLLPEDKDNLSNLSKVNVPFELTSMDYMVDGKMESLPLKEHPETDGGDEICAIDSTDFLSELHGRNASFSSDFSHALVSDVVESDESCKETEHDESLNFRYDPSEWTPMEIETATGDADCTLVEHSLKLSSTYAEVEKWGSDHIALVSELAFAKERSIQNS